MSLTRRMLARISYSIPQLRLYLVRENKRTSKVITVRTPQDASELLEPLRHASEEHFVAIHLNARHEVIGLHEVSHGTLSASLVHPREVFKAALVANSFAIIVCHNHPSGSEIVPSSEDFATTKQLLQAGKLLGVAVVDHLIVGAGSFIEVLDEPSTESAPNRLNTAYENSKSKQHKVNNVYSFRENYPQLWST